MEVLPAADVVVALWGVTPAHGGALSDNALLALQAMQVARHVGADRVLHCSSAAVYATDGRVATEDDRPDPASNYGHAKLAMEAAVQDWHDAHPGGPLPVCLRIGNVAGAESLFAAIEAGDALRLDRFADGTGPRRSYIAPGDLARVIAALSVLPLEQLAPVYNVAAPGVTAMADLAQSAGRVVTWRPAPKTAVPCVALDTTRLQGVLPLPLQASDADWLVADWKRWRAAR